MENISVVVVDDEPLIRSGLRAIIDAEPDLTVVGEAYDGAEVLPVVRRTQPDVVLMDVRMPAVDGIQATRLLLDGLDPAPRVLVVTTFENDDYVYDALRGRRVRVPAEADSAGRHHRGDPHGRGQRVTALPRGHPGTGARARLGAGASADRPGSVPADRAGAGGTATDGSRAVER